MRTLGVESCIALAQVLPVFLIALVATGAIQRRMRLVESAVASARSLIDGFLAVLLVVLEISVLEGIERGGYVGIGAALIWLGAESVVLLVVVRWVMDTPAGHRFMWWGASRTALLLSKIGQKRSRPRYRSMWDNRKRYQTVSVERDAQGRMVFIDKHGKKIKSRKRKPE